ncbi:hypothetical protein [Streptomyces eurythermus]
MHIAIDVLDGRAFNLVTLILAVGALLLTIAGLYYARRALFPPKRRLSYYLESASPLVNASGVLPGTIQVSRNGVALSDPHLVVIWIKNTGRHAIASDLFDQGRPLEVDLHAPIVELAAADGEGSTLASGYAAVGTKITYGPELIPSGRKITFTALVDGDPSVSLHDYFIDVQVKVAADAAINLRSVGLSAGAAVAGLLVNLLQSLLS